MTFRGIRHPFGRARGAAVLLALLPAVALAQPAAATEPPGAVTAAAEPVERAGPARAAPASGTTTVCTSRASFTHEGGPLAEAGTGQWTPAPRDR